MIQRTIETLVGLFLVLGILALLFLAFQVSGLNVGSFGQQQYKVDALFDNIGTLKVRAPVRIAGVEVGSVVSIRLNPQTFQAEVMLGIDKNITDIPVTSSARIASSSLLGDSYVSLTPGYYDDPNHPQNLHDGSVISTTYSATSIESLLATFMSSGGKTNDH